MLQYQQFLIKDLTELEQLADWILPYLKPNIFLLLQGDLGAGKTTFTQILARKLGIKNTRLLGGRFSANSSLGSAFAGFFGSFFHEIPNHQSTDKGYEKHNISEIINEAEKVGQLELAKKYDLPVLLHIREAFADAYEIVKVAGNDKGVLHCFTGTWEIAQKFIDLGFYISFAGNITYQNGK
ncbi:6783_t:CDS:2 [Entrophospora sp. SA101]|nr:6783_t:CDS:2 [Entrophospora sp. SA101]